MTKLSIITINYNNAFGLKKTIESVFNQNICNFEFLLIDGNSTDGSIELIELNSDKIDYWVSENDGGIYNAMNKGISKAKGEYFIFLNSGDVFYDNRVLERIEPHLDNYGIVYGDLVIKELKTSWLKKYNQQLSFEYFTRDTLPHQGAFIHKKLFEAVGLYDETGIISADWKFFLEATCRYGCKTKYIDQIISIYDYSGISSLVENQKKILN